MLSNLFPSLFKSGKQRRLACHMPDFSAAKNENSALVTFIVLRHFFPLAITSLSKGRRRRPRDEETGDDSGRQEERDSLLVLLEWQGQGGSHLMEGCTCALIYFPVFTEHCTAC